MSKGFLITFEGTDGSGKTTQINYLNDYLIQKGFPVKMLREPGGAVISEKIRNIILDNSNKEMSYVTEMLLYAASRAQLVEQIIIPEMNKGSIVICDRFVDSSYVYQGFARGLGLELVKKVNEIATVGVLPKITFFIDVDPETAILRRNSVSIPDRIESQELSFHKKVYNSYIELSRLYPERIKRIIGSGTKEEIWLSIKKYIDDIL